MTEFRALSLFMERTQSLSLNRQFEKIALLYQGAAYKMGSENMVETDCSGLICGTLNLMGYKIRVTADEIMKKLTGVNRDSEHPPVKLIGCRKDGKFTHIGIVLESGMSNVVYNASYPTGAQFESLWKFIDRYTKKGHSIEYGFLDWDRVVSMDGVAYGLDQELK